MNRHQHTLRRLKSTLKHCYHSNQISSSSSRLYSCIGRGSSEKWNIGHVLGERVPIMRVHGDTPEYFRKCTVKKHQIFSILKTNVSYSEGSLGLVACFMCGGNLKSLYCKFNAECSNKDYSRLHDTSLWALLIPFPIS